MQIFKDNSTHNNVLLPYAQIKPHAGVKTNINATEAKPEKLPLKCNNENLAGEKLFGIGKCSYLKKVTQPWEFRGVYISGIMDVVQSLSSKKITDKVRNAYKTYGALVASDPTNKEAHTKALQNYRDIKARLPAVSFSGIYEKKVTNANFKAFSGIFLVDLDHLEDVEAAKAK